MICLKGVFAGVVALAVSFFVLFVGVGINASSTLKALVRSHGTQSLSLVPVFCQAFSQYL